MTQIRAELHRVVCGESATDLDTVPLRTETLCQSDVERIIVDCISARKFSKALQCVRYYGSVVELCAMNDVLLSVVCWRWVHVCEKCFGGPCLSEF